jgi:hypothetical protein
MVKKIIIQTLFFMKKEWFRLTIILIGLLLVLATFSYISAQNTRNYAEQTEKAEKEKRDYIAKRRNDCFDIYDKEKGNWNNVTGNRYDEDTDSCYVTYRDNKNNKTASECKDEWFPDGKVSIFSFAYHYYSLCVDHEFEKSF